MQLKGHLKQNGLNENDIKLKWLMMLNFCFKAADYLFNYSWNSFISYSNNNQLKLVESSFFIFILISDFNDIFLKKNIIF